MEKTLLLEPWEALLLAERVPANAVHFETGEVVGRAFLLKIFSAMDEMTTDDSIGPGGPVEINITENELWIIKACISIFEKVDGKPVGLKLRRKTHALILSFNSEVEDLPFGQTSEEPSYEGKEVEDETDIEPDPNGPKDGAQDKPKPPSGTSENLPRPERKDKKKD